MPWVRAKQPRLRLDPETGTDPKPTARTAEERQIRGREVGRRRGRDRQAPRSLAGEDARRRYLGVVGRTTGSPMMTLQK
ncbi:MAG: hypothetical protein WB558_13510 [Terriglobales bacterium]